MTYKVILAGNIYSIISKKILFVGQIIRSLVSCDIGFCLTNDDQRYSTKIDKLFIYISFLFSNYQLSLYDDSNMQLMYILNEYT